MEFGEIKVRDEEFEKEDRSWKKNAKRK